MTNFKKPVTAGESDLERWHPYIQQCLDREPRGLRAIVAWDEQGRPRVIQVALVVDGKPFPTVFWLIDPALCLAIDRLEAAGCIAGLNSGLMLRRNYALQCALIMKNTKRSGRQL